MPIEYVPDLDVVREQVQEEEHVCPVSSESIFSGTVGVAIVMLALLLLYLIMKWRDLLGMLCDSVFTYVDVDGSGTIDRTEMDMAVSASTTTHTLLTLPSHTTPLLPAAVSLSFPPSVSLSLFIIHHHPFEKIIRRSSSCSGRSTSTCACSGPRGSRWRATSPRPMPTRVGSWTGASLRT